MKTNLTTLTQISVRLIHLDERLAQIILLVTTLTIPIFGSAQLKGMEEYVPVSEYYNIAQKIHITTNNDYDYQIIDAVDNSIFLEDIPLVYQECRRIIEMNGGIMESGVVEVGSSKGITVREITTGILSGDQVVFIRWDLPNGYHVYLNIRDEFCGVAATMDDPE